MRKNECQSGFTLIELVVVIAVLAILAIVAVPVVSGIVQNAKASSDKAQVAMLQSAIERYNAENDAYPGEGATTDADLRAAVVAAIEKYTNLTDVSGFLPAPKNSSSGKFIYTKSTHKISTGNDDGADSGAVAAISN